MDLPAGMWGQAVSATMLRRSIPAGGGQDPSIHAEISAAKQVLRGLTLLVVYQGSAQYRLASPGAADGGSREFSLSSDCSCSLKR